MFRRRLSTLPEDPPAYNRIDRAHHRIGGPPRHSGTCPPGNAPVRTAPDARDLDECAAGIEQRNAAAHPRHDRRLAQQILEPNAANPRSVSFSSAAESNLERCVHGPQAGSPARPARNQGQRAESVGKLDLGPGRQCETRDRARRTSPRQDTTARESGESHRRTRRVRLRRRGVSSRSSSTAHRAAKPAAGADRRGESIRAAPPAGARDSAS